VVTVTVDAGRREDHGQAVEELEGGEAESGTTGRVCLGQDVENLVRAAVDQMEPFECKGGPGTVADQPFQSLPVGGLDADAGIQAEPAPVIPRQHVFGFVRLQEAVAAKVAEDSFLDRVLEVLQELVGEGRGFVKAEADGGSGRVLIRVLFNLLEEPIHDAHVVMEMGV
jgi:hypothetical protein